MDYLKMGRRIQKRRLEISMTQEKLESLTELSSVFISQIENGARKPSLGSIVKIANALGTTVDELLKDSVNANTNYAIRSFSTLIEGHTEAEISSALDILETALTHMKNGRVVK